MDAVVYGHRLLLDMEQSSRVLSQLVYRKALLLAFRLVTSSNDVITTEMIQKQLRLMFVEFREALNQFNKDLLLTEEEWTKDVINNTSVVNFLQEHFSKEYKKKICM